MQISFFYYITAAQDTLESLDALKQKRKFFREKKQNTLTSTAAVELTLRAFEPEHEGVHRPQQSGQTSVSKKFILCPQQPRPDYQLLAKDSPPVIPHPLGSEYNIFSLSTVSPFEVGG